jgi:hypothetical protein
MGRMMDKLWLNSQQRQEIFLFPHQVGGGFQLTMQWVLGLKRLDHEANHSSPFMP